MIECESVSAVAILPERLYFAVVPSYDSLRREIAEQKKADAAEYRALRELKAFCNLLYLWGGSNQAVATVSFPAEAGDGAVP